MRVLTLAILVLLWIGLLGCAFGVVGNIVLGQYTQAILPGVLAVANAFLIYVVLSIRRRQVQ